MALDYGGYQPNVHFEVLNNSIRDVTGGIGILIDGNPDGMALSHGHVVRGNTVVGHIAPPSAFGNFDGAITVGVDADDPACGCSLHPLISMVLFLAFVPWSVRGCGWVGAGGWVRVRGCGCVGLRLLPCSLSTLAPRFASCSSPLSVPKPAN
jgi:hypothetical protein